NHLFKWWETLLAASAGIVDFQGGVVTDVGNVIGIEEGAIVGELWEFVAVAESAALVTDIAGERNRFAWRQWLVESVDRIHVAWRGADHVEWPVELEVGD